MNNLTLFNKLVFVTQMFKRRNVNKKNISHGQGRILAILNRNDGISTKELSEILNINVTSLNETLNKLQENKYIEKRHSTEDKRILLIYLTDKGHNFKFEKPNGLEIFDCLSETQKEEFSDCLTLIMKEMHNKMHDENPEKFEEIVKHRQEMFKKYFNCEDDDEWFNLI